MSVLYLSHILRGLVEIWRKKMARKRHFTTDEVLRELAVDSNSDREPEDDAFFFFFFCQMVMILSLEVVMKPC